jgi:hypothetical protein
MNIDWLINIDWLLLAQVAEATDAPAPLSTAGLTVMVVSVGSVLCLISFCLFKVMTLPPVEDDEDEYHPPRSLSM